MNIAKLPYIPDSLLDLKKPPRQLFFMGDTTLLDTKIKIAIVGTRAPNPYTKLFCSSLASAIVKAGGVVVSGGALGVDIIAHTSALPNTIMFSPSSLEIIYPSANKNIIEQIAKNALIISEYERNYFPKRHSFLERNRLVVGLGDILIIPQADRNSGSLHSARIATNLGKKIFVLPHRLNESLGTQDLLKENLASCIYDIDAFIKEIFGEVISIYDELLEFCKDAPSIESAIMKFGDRVLEYELEGLIRRENGVFLVC